MTAAVLLVTWFYFGQPPANSQTQFPSMEACQIARETIMQEASRLRSDADKEVARFRAQGMFYNPAPPTVSVVCVAR